MGRIKNGGGGRRTDQWAPAQLVLLSDLGRSRWRRSRRRGRRQSGARWRKCALPSTSTPTWSPSSSAASPPSCAPASRQPSTPSSDSSTPSTGRFLLPTHPSIHYACVDLVSYCAERIDSLLVGLRFHSLLILLRFICVK